MTALGYKLRQHTLPFAELGTTIEALLKAVLPPDDSAIQFSPAGYGVTADLDTTLSEMYERYVEQYAGEQDVPSRSDDEVWRVFRTALEQHRVLSKLEPKKITAPDYDYQFRAAWQNKIWHVYEAVSFDLVEPTSLLEKANRWVGRSASLIESQEPFRLHILIGIPQDARLQTTFKKARNILRKMAGDPEFVMEDEAESFAADLAHEIGIHDGDSRPLFELC
ncbi:MAG: hypothetical protein ACLP59_07085 [Bryobacteraceae bacterium]